MLALLFVTLPFVVRAVQPVLLELDREMEEAAASLGARPLDGLPPDRPAEPARRRSSPAPALGFARALGEFGSLVLITGNIPFKTEVASVFIFGAGRERQRAPARRRCRWCCSLISFVVLLVVGRRLARGGRAMSG